MLEEWSINRLANECDMDRRTVTKMLAETEPAGFQADGKPTYHLKDLILVLRGKDQEGASSLEKERTRLTRSEANRSEMIERQIRGELLEPDPVLAGMENVAGAIKRVITSSKLPIPDQDAILRQLQNLNLKEILEKQCPESIPEVP